jgi:hypothetical protein
VVGMILLNGTGVRVASMCPVVDVSSLVLPLPIWEQRVGPNDSGGHAPGEVRHQMGLGLLHLETHQESFY